MSRNKTRGSRIKTYLTKFHNIHGDRYTYPHIHDEFIDAHNEITIRCAIHGPFKQKPKVHVRGMGCSSCGKESKSMSPDNFVKRATEKYGNKYLYDMTTYKNARTKITITCPIHGQFEQTPRQHLTSSAGCWCCGQNTPTTKHIIDQFKTVHGTRYSYSDVIYTSMLSKVSIQCPVHGEFKQTPRKHLEGNGCPCCNMPHSRKACMWMNAIANRESINIQHADNGGEYRIAGTKLKVDGYCATTNTIYEFYGDVFHGNPKRFKESEHCHPFDKSVTAGDLFSRTMKREQLLLDMGFNIISIWEHEYDNDSSCNG